MIRPEFTLDTINIWFPNQKEPIYDPEDPDLMMIFKAYWREERRRMIEGFEIDGVSISGWLYWHTVYYHIVLYKEVLIGGKKRKVRDLIVPLLRDIEWIVADDFVRCEDLGKFYMLIGSRDFGKSIIAASRAAYLYTLFSNSESVISSSEKTFIKLATNKIEDGLTHLHPVLKKQRIANNWEKEVKAGWKDKATNQPDPKSSNSVIYVRNYEMGNKSMACAGTRPGFHLIDEVGTLPNFIGCIKDSEGAWYSGEGTEAKPSCLTMYAGTGGDMDSGKEASEVFYAPEAYNVLDFEDKWEGRGRIGRFITATMANMDYKDTKTLAEYLGVESETLSKIKIRVSDEERAKREWWDKEYEKARRSKNQKAILKFLARSPIKPSDSFLVLTKNDFNIPAAQEQIKRIKALDKVGTPIELRHDGVKIVHDISQKLPISSFPYKDDGNPNGADAPIMIYEFPIEQNPPFGLYVAGVDPYRQASSEYSESLGAVYIFKRIHNIQSEKYQYMFVASYVARPNNKEDWNSNARMLIKYYNALTLCENDEMSFIDYMVAMGDSIYLATQPQWLKEIAPNSKVNRDFGIHMSNDRIRSHVFGKLKRYLDMAWDSRRDVTGSVISEVLNVSRVFDAMLLEEVVHFNFDGNFDRIIAAALAVTLADHLDPQYKVSSTEDDPRLKAYFERNKTRITKQSILGSPSRKYRSGKPKIFNMYINDYQNQHRA
jgi:hypothetical protein